MSHYDYELSKEISSKDPPFAALIMSAIRKADTENSFKLGEAWPEIFTELKARYNAPGGLLEDEL